MRATIYRRTLERIFGFAEPVGRDGVVLYECPYCGVRGDDQLDHTAFCGYWHVAPLFDSPIGRRLVDQVLPAA